MPPAAPRPRRSVPHTGFRRIDQLGRVVVDGVASRRPVPRHGGENTGANRRAAGSRRKWSKCRGSWPRASRPRPHQAAPSASSSESPGGGEVGINLRVGPHSGVRNSSITSGGRPVAEARLRPGARRCRSFGRRTKSSRSRGRAQAIGGATTSELDLDQANGRGLTGRVRRTEQSTRGPADAQTAIAKTVSIGAGAGGRSR